jgi:D-3-phosphoglycerate dehydrogenase
MLFVENDDIPGVVGQLGAVLANFNVNIGHLSLGRIKDKKIALNVFNLDVAIGEGVLKEITGIKGVSQAYVANL